LEVVLERAVTALPSADLRPGAGRGPARRGPSWACRPTRTAGRPAPRLQYSRAADVAVFVSLGRAGPCLPKSSAPASGRSA